MISEFIARAQKSFFCDAFAECAKCIPNIRASLPNVRSACRIKKVLILGSGLLSWMKQNTKGWSGFFEMNELTQH